MISKAKNLLWIPLKWKKNQGIEKNSQKNHGLKKWGIWKKWKQKLGNWKMNKEKQSWNLNEKLIKWKKKIGKTDKK